MQLGKFISVEGIDGSGKSSNIQFIADYLRNKGFSVITTRDPGGTPFGEQLRNTVRCANVSFKTELFLYTTVRQQLVDELIKPALEKGIIVISDRYFDSTYAYQGKLRGLIDDVLKLEQIVGDGLRPDHTIWLDISVEESIKRTQISRGGEPDDRFDNGGKSLKETLYYGYLERYQNDQDRIVQIVAEDSLDVVQKRLSEWLEEVFIPANKQLIKNELASN